MVGEQPTVSGEHHGPPDFHTSGVTRGRAQPPKIAVILGPGRFGGGLMTTSTYRLPPVRELTAELFIAAGPGNER
jgi:hypothetical protein